MNTDGAQSIRCPACGATPAQPCITQGRAVTHQDRLDTAEQARRVAEFEARQRR